VIGIFGLSAMTSAVPVTELPGRLGADLRRVASTPVLLVAALLYVSASVSAVAFFPDETSAAQHASAQPAVTGDASTAFAQAWAQQPRLDLGIAPDGAKVVVVKFIDYECPGCRSAEMLYKPIFDKFAASHPGAVQVVVKDWPWDARCNFRAQQTIRGHEAACDAAAAARMARERGKFDEMTAWLYANQGATQAAVRAAAASMLGVTDFEREYALKLPEIRRDIADGAVLNINSTPTYFINGVRLPTEGGLMQPNYFELAINLELQKAS
jgi:protein-disulfide isomerase